MTQDNNDTNGSVNKLKQLGQDTITSWQTSIPSRAAAALAYRSIFSLAPLLFISIMVVGLVFGEQAARNEISGVLTDTLGPDAAQFVENNISSAAERTGSGLSLSSLAGFVLLLYGASSLFKELKIALNTVWGLPPAGESGFWPFVRTQLTAFVMVFSVGFFFMLLVFVNIAISVVSSYFFPGQAMLWQLASLAGSFVGLSLLILLLYRLVPDATVPWSDLWVGAAVTALLMGLGIYAVSLYMGYGNVGSAFGAAQALIILLLWIYYTALIFLLGASFTRAYALNYGSQQALPELPSDDDSPDS